MSPEHPRYAQIVEAMRASNGGETRGLEDAGPETPGKSFLSGEADAASVALPSRPWGDPRWRLLRWGLLGLGALVLGVFLLIKTGLGGEVLLALVASFVAAIAGSIASRELKVSGSPSDGSSARRRP
jgi:hypothetical protein